MNFRWGSEVDVGSPPGILQAQKVLFYYNKKQVFEDRPFRSRGAKVDSVGRDGTKMEAKSNPTTINKRTSNIYQQMETKTHKWSQQGVRTTRASFVTTRLDSEPKNGQGKSATEESGRILAWYFTPFPLYTPTEKLKLIYNLQIFIIILTNHLNATDWVRASPTKSVVLFRSWI